MNRRTSGNARFAPDGEMMRDLSSPGGTLEDTQTFDGTPKKGTRHGCSTSKRALARQRAANSTGIHLVPLGVGPERAKKQKVQPQEVCRAELSAEQPAQKRDALNAWQKAYKQVIMGMYSPCTQQPKLITHSSLMALAVQSSAGVRPRRMPTRRAS